MNQHIVCTLAATVIGSIAMANAGELEDVKAAAKKLGEADNYTWLQTTKVPADAQFQPQPVNGKADKDGTVDYKTSFFNNEMHAVIKGEKAAMLGQEGNWQSLDELSNNEGPGRFMASLIRGIEAPSVQVAEIAATVEGWKSEDGALSGELTKEGAIGLMRWGGRNNSNGPEIFGAVGDAKFWIKDGALVKYQYHVEGLMEFNGKRFRHRPHGHHRDQGRRFHQDRDPGSRTEKADVNFEAETLRYDKARHSGGLLFSPSKVSRNLLQ